jgi:hypothetical protein
MADAAIVLALAAGILLARPNAPWYLVDPISTWLAIGRQNVWIRRAWDPPFDRTSFEHAPSVERLRQRLLEVSWSAGKAFWMDGLCLIQKVSREDPGRRGRRTHPHHAAAWLLSEQAVLALLQGAGKDRPQSLEDLLRDKDAEKIKRLTRPFLDDRPGGREKT